MFPADFGRERVARSACSNNGPIILFAERISALNKIVWEYSVKGGVVVKTILDELLEVGDSLRRVRIVESDRENALLAVRPFSPLKIEYCDRIR